MRRCAIVRRMRRQRDNEERPPRKLGAGRRPVGGQRRRRARERNRAHGLCFALCASRRSPVQIKTGISDGIVTEVIEGLKEGDRVVTAELGSTAAAPSPATNPFGGARRFP